MSQLDSSESIPPPSLRALVGASRQMSLEPDPVGALEILVSAVRDDLGVDRVGIFAYEPHEHSLQRVFGIDVHGQPETGPEVLALTDARHPLLDVARRDRPFFFSNDVLSEYPDLEFDPPVHSLAVIPIIAGEELLGALCADNVLSGRPLLEEIRDVLFLYAGLAALPLFARYQSREAVRTDAMRARIHCEVLAAVTGGKMKLCGEEQMRQEWPAWSQAIPVRQDSDVRNVRQAVLEAAKQAGMNPDRAAELGLCASEAATNALLHGCGGRATVGVKEGQVRVRIEDQGGGIPAEDLPRATLQKGWSSRASMGLGFTVIKETADEVLLCTGPAGTEIIIQMDVEPQESELDHPLLRGEMLAF